MKVYYEVITTPTADTPGTALSLHYPDKRYIFGQLSEGTQRACTERGVRIASLSDVFITGRTEWANTGGLIGIILTLADAIASGNAAAEDENRKKAMRRAANQALPKNKAGAISTAPVAEDIAIEKSHLTIHGTTNLTHTLATARRFVFRKGTPLYTKEYDTESVAKQARNEAEDPFETPTWSDANIKVWALPIKPFSPTNFDMPTPARPKSPRKRSLDEFQESDEPKSGVDQRTADTMVRQSVVTDMFNSTWKMDALIETPLAEVKMPAAMFIRNPETKDMEPYNGPKPGEDLPLPDIKVFVRQPWPGAKVDSLPPTSPSNDALCYIVRNHDIRGKFEIAKARELLVPKGPAYAALTRGESVQSEDGKTITADMVLGPSRLGKGLAIMDLPSVEYVESLINRPEWKSPAVTTELQSFVWILGPGVGDHPKLREFVATFPHCEHTVSSTDYCPNYLALRSTGEASVRLARLKGDSYSIPVHDNVTLPQNRALLPRSAPAPHALQNSPFKRLDPGLVIDMEPEFKLNKDEVVPHLNTAKTIFQIPKAVEQRMSVIRSRVAKPKFQQHLEYIRKDLPGGDAEIVALGTGSSSPSKYRNVSATLVYAPGSGYYLLDCGENTLGQLERVFEPEKLREVFQNLRMIWISHLHADHHLGTASVIKAWYNVNFGPDAKPAAHPETDLAKILQEKRLFVASDEMMITWLEEYASVENFGFDKVLPLSAHPEASQTSIVTKFTYRHTQHGGPPFGRDAPGKTILDFNDDSSPLTPLLKASTGLTDVLTTHVKHCRGALALSLVFPDGFKVSYSGDCRPSDKFASIGRDSTVLIHEATFQDDMVGSAIAKRHSTAGEAIEIGRRMGARSILLTHFSQRYQKIAHVDQQTGTLAHDDISSTKKAATAAQKKLNNIADIPFDDPVDEPATIESGAKLLDDIMFPSKARPPLPRSQTQIPRENTPVAAAMDYMRIKVRDLALAQAYAPALEKLIEVMERQSAEKSAYIKQKAQELEEARKAKGKKKGLNKKAAAAAAVVSAAAVTDEPEEQKKPAHSAFSASESESGWETSDLE
ncbi:hypothetical protein N7490_006394 [Penicillium lividum]|nr:hypothetical protein N7490_006394 [Penicillium lividum]